MQENADDTASIGHEYEARINAILGVGNEHLYGDIMSLMLADTAYDTAVDRQGRICLLGLSVCLSPHELLASIVIC